MSDGNQNGWNEYSRLVLKELETLASSIDGLRSELQEIKQDMAAMRVREDKIDELKVWKEKIDEVASPSQIKEMVNEIDSLKQFKTKAVTVFAVVQFLMAAAVAASKVFG
jgi:alanyl-tRNA synthetase